MTQEAAMAALWGATGPTVRGIEDSADLLVPVEGGQVELFIQAGKVSAVRGPRVHWGRKVLVTVGERIGPALDARLPGGGPLPAEGRVKQGAPGNFWLKLDTKNSAVVEAMLEDY
ncbi:MAG: hypothetical protein HY319_10130 [Armatimonadetes bacterium]|nr:hypothetical protein [Armatimonadota bacterium]